MSWIKRLFAYLHRDDSRVSDALWARIVTLSSAARHLDAGSMARLRHDAAAFIQEKSFESANGMILDDAMRLQIALHACLLTLNLRHIDYGDLHSIIVYPDVFIAPHQQIDQSGVVHAGDLALAGESWLRGPVVLSWSTVRNPRPAGNVIIHEFAHKIDGVNGAVNGFPPMPSAMSARRWSAVFQEAFEELSRRLDAGEPAGIDPYAAMNAAEFFAVCCECFFEDPDSLVTAFPGVYDQLETFFAQSTLSKGD
ncbi:MAG: hypothetical protein HKN42_20035 [Granulosicoccus sp.]|nr:hypothetical protein [Granulosicoccus sp.]